METARPVDHPSLVTTSADTDNGSNINGNINNNNNNHDNDNSQTRQRRNRSKGEEDGGHGHDKDDGDSSADETTSIVSHRGSGLNYQTTQQRPATAATGVSFSSASRPATAATTVAKRRQDGGSREAAPAQAASRPGGGGGGGSGGRKNLLAEFLSQFHSIELENKGSVARDHLAIERTFLAWLRTSLAFASIGIAVTQLFRLNTVTSDPDSGSNDNSGSGDSKTLAQLGKPLGTTFLGISIMVLLLGYRRYVESQRWVMEGKFPASRGTVLLVSAVAFALIVASLVVVVAVPPSTTER